MFLESSTHWILLSTIGESMPQSGAEILLATGFRGAVIGTSIESISVLNLENALAALYVWTLSLSSIRRGECGSWAFNFGSGELLGMLVATCPALGEAYIIPAKYIVADIRSTEWADSTRLPQDSPSALHRAVINGDIQTLDSVLSQGIDPNESFRHTYSTLLYRAAGSGDTERVKQLIAEGVDINEGYYSRDVPPIFEAVRSGNVEALGRLLAAGFDVNKQRVEVTFTPLYAAIKAGYSHVAEALVSAGADRDKIAVNTSVLALFEAVDPNAAREGTIQSAEQVEELYPNEHVRMILASAKKEAAEKEAAERGTAKKGLSTE